MHDWVNRDPEGLPYKKCNRCELEVSQEAFDEGWYPIHCSLGYDSECPDGAPHYIEAGITKGQCAYCDMEWE